MVPLYLLSHANYIIYGNEGERMLKKNETREVIFEHPKGYFDVIERRGLAPYGKEYRIREWC